MNDEKLTNEERWLLHRWEPDGIDQGIHIVQMIVGFVVVLGVVSLMVFISYLFQ